MVKRFRVQLRLPPILFSWKCFSNLLGVRTLRKRWMKEIKALGHIVENLCRCKRCRRDSTSTSTLTLTLTPASTTETMKNCCSVFSWSASEAARRFCRQRRWWLTWRRKKDVVTERRNGNFPDDANYRFLVIAKGKNVPDATNDRKLGIVQHKF